MNRISNYRQGFEGFHPSAGSTRGQESGLEGLCPSPCSSGLELAVIDFSMPEISISTNYSLTLSLL